MDRKIKNRRTDTQIDNNTLKTDETDELTDMNTFKLNRKIDIWIDRHIDTY